MTQNKDDKPAKKHVPNPNGRPIQNIIEPIDDTPKNVVASIMLGVGKKDLGYLD